MTEKNYNPGQKENKAMSKQKIVEKMNAADTPKEKTEVKKDEEVVEEKKESKKKPEKIKKEEAVVNAKNLPISTLFSIASNKLIVSSFVSQSVSFSGVFHSKSLYLIGKVQSIILFAGGR